MKLDQQVTNLEPSKKLKELNIKQESLFYWEWVNDNCYGVRYFPYCVTPRNAGEFLHYSAFTASELMEHLPDRIILLDAEPFDCYRFHLSRFIVIGDDMQPYSAFSVNYLCDTHESPHFLSKHLFSNIWDKSLCDALAKTLIHLIENNFMELHP